MFIYLLFIIYHVIFSDFVRTRRWRRTTWRTTTSESKHERTSTSTKHLVKETTRKSVSKSELATLDIVNFGKFFDITEQKARAAGTLHVIQVHNCYATSSVDVCRIQKSNTACPVDVSRIQKSNTAGPVDVSWIQKSDTACPVDTSQTLEWHSPTYLPWSNSGFGKPRCIPTSANCHW